MYQIKLTDAEMKTLAWLTDRGYFPEETYDDMDIAEDETGRENYLNENGEIEWIYQIPEHAAWVILEHREDDPHSLYTCCGGSLLEKLLELERSII